MRVTMKLDLLPKRKKVNSPTAQPWMTWLAAAFFFASLWYGMYLVMQFVSSLDLRAHPLPKPQRFTSLFKRVFSRQNVAPRVNGFS